MVGIGIVEDTDYACVVFGVILHGEEAACLRRAHIRHSEDRNANGNMLPVLCLYGYLAQLKVNQSLGSTERRSPMASPNICASFTAGLNIEAFRLSP